MSEKWVHEGNLEKRFQEPECDSGSEAAEGEHTGEVVSKWNTLNRRWWLSCYEVKERKKTRMNLDLSYYPVDGWCHKAVKRSMCWGQGNKFGVGRVEFQESVGDSKYLPKLNSKQGACHLSQHTVPVSWELCCFLYASLFPLLQDWVAR